MANHDCRSHYTASLAIPAPAPAPAPAWPVPSVLPDSDRAPVDAGALLQSQIDELVVLQARLARLDRTWLPYLLGDAGPNRPPLTGSLLLASTLVDFQQRLRALARRCGHLARRTQRQLGRTQRAARRVGALWPQPNRSQPQERADGHR